MVLTTLLDLFPVNFKFQMLFVFHFVIIIYFVKLKSLHVNLELDNYLSVDVFKLETTKIFPTKWNTKTKMNLIIDCCKLFLCIIDESGNLY